MSELFGASPRPKKALGQNFLQDKNISRKIVAALQIEPEDFVVEIGPGPGALTKHILEAGPARFLVVEKDRHYAAERKAGGGLDSVLTDALTVPWERFSAPFKCIGNLPYNVASPLMWDIFSKASGLTRAVFMVQKEVGLRLAANPGTSAYGALSVWVQTFVRPKVEFIVPPQVFFPRPKVDSAVLSFEPLPRNVVRNFSEETLARTLKMIFQMRRKQLGSVLRHFNIPLSVLEKLELDPIMRPEVLTPNDFHRLAGSGFF